MKVIVAAEMTAPFQVVLAQLHPQTVDVCEWHRAVALASHP